MKKTDVKLSSNIFNFTVLVSALGYFVDIFDLLLFSIVRTKSLRDLGVGDSELLNVGVHLLNMQMIGLLIGGIVWGILGDKRGRISVLFGSILMYSIANIANAFVTNPEVYGWLRLFAGIGLAGELGAAITLVGETMTKEKRGYGTTVVASIGILGAVLANLIGGWFTWRTAYIIGGVMGLGLLVLRLAVFESGMFEHTKKSGASRGDFFLLLRNKNRLKRYLGCIFIGLPIWFVIGILVTFSPELARELKVEGVILAGDAVMYAYIGLALGDLASGLLSQWLKSRKNVVFGFLVLTIIGVAIYMTAVGFQAKSFYLLCSYLGFSVGYWAVFITTASETFGTNLRATVASTVPNFVRGSVVPMTGLFQFLKPSLGLLGSATAVGILSLTIAGIALFFTEETFGKDLHFLESEI